MTIGKAKCLTTHETKKNESANLSSKHLGGPIGDVHKKLACTYCKIGRDHLAHNAEEPDPLSPYTDDGDLANADLTSFCHSNIAETKGVAPWLGTHNSGD